MKKEYEFEWYVFTNDNRDVLSKDECEYFIVE